MRCIAKAPSRPAGAGPALRVTSALGVLLWALAWGCSEGQLTENDAQASASPHPVRPPSAVEVSRGTGVRTGADSTPDTVANRIAARTTQRAPAQREAAAQQEAAAQRDAAAPLANAEPDPVLQSGAQHSEQSEPEQLLATRRQSWVYPEPDTRKAALGYLRAGARVERRGPLTQGAGCGAGFYPVAPRGFVCAAEVSTDPEHPFAHALSRRPDRRSGLPYLYGRSRPLTPHLYNRIPTSSELEQSDPGGKLSAAWSPLLAPEPPAFLRAGQTSLRFDGKRRSELTLSSGRARAASAFAFLELFESDGQAFGLSTDLSVLALDRLDLVEPSSFAGVPLSPERNLPLAFAQGQVQLFTGHPHTGLKLSRRALQREALFLTDQVVALGRTTFRQTLGGEWLVLSSALNVIEPLKQAPHWATPHRTWLDISTDRQTLVAYSGAQAVYATLVSTGAAGAEDPSNSRATVQGEFLIHTKHVTSTMDSDVEGDSYDLRDVPYVQYFSGGTALHAAYWHDDFGAARSHGCVNLSPLDARWLFDFSEPKVPEHWHGAMSLLNGTLVSVHP